MDEWMKWMKWMKWMDTPNPEPLFLHASPLIHSSNHPSSFTLILHPHPSAVTAARSAVQPLSNQTVCPQSGAVGQGSRLPLQPPDRDLAELRRNTSSDRLT